MASRDIAPRRRFYSDAEVDESVRVRSLHARWLRKARRVVRWDGHGQVVWTRKSLDLARDIWRALDPEGYRKETRR